MFHVIADIEQIVKKYNQKNNNDKFRCGKPLKKYGFKRNYIWNPSICIFKPDEICGLDECLNS